MLPVTGPHCSLPAKGQGDGEEARAGGAGRGTLGSLVIPGGDCCNPLTTVDATPGGLANAKGHGNW